MREFHENCDSEIFTGKKKKKINEPRVHQRK